MNECKETVGKIFCFKSSFPFSQPLKSVMHNIFKNCLTSPIVFYCVLWSKFEEQTTTSAIRRLQTFFPKYFILYISILNQWVNLWEFVPDGICRIKMGTENCRCSCLVRQNGFILDLKIKFHFLPKYFSTILDFVAKFRIFRNF